MGMKILMILMSAIVLISVAQINIIFAQSTFISGVEVEDDVINALENSEWVSVTIKLHDRNEIIRDSVISSLLGSEFRLKERLLREDGFSGNLTREGLNKLLNNSEVRLIYLNRVASVTTNETNNKPKNQKTNSELNMILIILLILAVLLIVIYLMFKKRKKV